MALNPNKKSNTVAPMGTNELWQGVLDKQPKKDSSKKSYSVRGYQKNLVVNQFTSFPAPRGPEKRTVDTLVLYKKYQEKAKLPFYTTYSKSDWSQIRFVTIGIATGSRIRQWAEKTLPNGKVVGEVTNANTLHHKTFKPIKGGLFCERIFGPLKDFECACSSNLGKQIKKLKKTQKKNQNLGLKGDNTAALVAQETLQKLLRTRQKKVAMRSNNYMGTGVADQRFFCPQCDVEYTWSVMRRYQLGYIHLNAPVAHVWYLKSSPNYLSALLDMKRKHIEYITYCTETLTLENSLKSSAEVLTNVADTFDFINRSRAKENSFVKAESTNGLLSYDSNGVKSIWPVNNRATGKGLLPKQKKNTYYYQKQYLSARTAPGGGVSTGSKTLRKNPKKFTLFNNKSKESFGAKFQANLLMGWLTTNAINGLLQKYDKKVVAAKALRDLNFSAEMYENTFSKTEEGPCGKAALFYSMRQLARSSVVLTFLQTSSGDSAAQNNSYGVAAPRAKKDFFFNKHIPVKTVLASPSKNERGSRTMFGVSNSSVRLGQNLTTLLAQSAFIKDCRTITNFKVARLTRSPVGQVLLYNFKLANFETFCHFKLLTKKKQDVGLNRVNLKVAYSILKEKLRQAYVMQLEASLSMQHNAKRLQTASDLSNINWKQTLTLAHFSSNSLKAYQVAQQDLTINNLTKMVDMICLLVGAPRQSKYRPGGPKDEVQQALPNKLISLAQVCSAVKSLLPQRLFEQVYSNIISRLLFVKQLLTPLFCVKDFCQKSLSANATESPDLKNNVRNMTQKSNMGTNKLVKPTKLLTPLLLQQPPVRQNIKAALNNRKLSLVFGRSFLASRESWPLIRFVLALAKREQSYSVYANGKAVPNPSLFAPQSTFSKKKAKTPQGPANVDEKEHKSCLILRAYRLRKIKKTKATLGTGVPLSLTKRFIAPQLQKTNKFNSKKTIVNNIYCFSHRLLWNHAVDWQFFSLYYFSFKAVNTKTNLYNNPVSENARSTGARVKNMANLEDVNVPVYAYRNYDFSLLNTFFSQDLKAKSSLGVPTKFNFTQELADKQNLHINYSGAGILKTLLADLDNPEIRKIYKQNVMTLFALNKRIVRTRQLLLISNQAGDSKGITKRKSSRRTYQKDLNEMCQNRELIMGKIKLLRKLFHAERPTGLAQQQETSFLKKSHNKHWFKRSKENSSALTQANPKDMVLTLLPVLPPDLRPIVKMGTQIAASDLNRFYQRILYRNDRLKRFLKDAAINGSYEMKYAQRLLQEAVDNLIQNGKSGVTPEKDARGRLLKSLSDILKGKQGRFRQYLLGKRVDYSGRSVIVVGPSLKLHECGIPKEMALELFLPFLIKRILTDNLARTVIGAKTLIKNNKPLTWALLREILKSSPVLLNRAPTLHRLGFQAFQPKLVDGRAILLHPLVCPAFNADFDGDQMAVHVPISPEARAEAWKLMLSRNNLLSPATGEPLVLPSQDMVLGCYYLTTNSNAGFEGKIQKSEKGYGLYFNSLNDVLRAYQQGLLSIHAIIWLKWNGKVENSLRTGNGNIAEHEPAEIRLNQYGGSHVIYSRSYSTFNYSQSNNTPLGNNVLPAINNKSYKAKNKLVNNIIRTTPGKILFNVIVGMALNNTN